MIQNFKSKSTQELFRNGHHRDYGSYSKAALRKLLLLESASALTELRDPPGNRLEALKGDRVDQHSTRINDQYRICFIWKSDGAYSVEITDYH
jgi:proteic killer suppression protein